MTGRHLVSALALLSIICTLAILLFPLASGHGPYSATHGPVTSLRAVKAASLLRLGMVLAATSLLTLAAGAVCSLAFFALPLVDYPSNYSRLAQLTSILRC